MAGTVSWQEFLKCITEIVEISDKLSDGWLLRGDQDVPGGAYLSKKCIVPDNINSPIDTPHTLEEPLDDLLQDPSAIEKSTTATRITWEYHILYSPSYSVPTLYFNVWKSDGRLLTLEEVWDRVHQCYQESMKEKRWSVLTQQEHPVLRRPFDMLHPCRSAEFLEALKEKSSNIVITWLSTVGPTVGLILGIPYSQAVLTS